jgi:hypothetical protein
MLRSANQAVLGEQFELRITLPISCLFCGNAEENRFMCRRCRPLPLYHVVWGFPLKEKTA